MISNLPVEVATNLVVDGNVVVVVVVVAAVVVDVVGATVVVRNIIPEAKHNENNIIITEYTFFVERTRQFFSGRKI